ncbi:hypothetical protein B0H14DRAFT_3583085 [Mycena olivaceomarginata]|nr:hypothetical protein B0H14DRAFT_3583085 [Mycena olivaceomarginata]
MSATTPLQARFLRVINASLPLPASTIVTRRCKLPMDFDFVPSSQPLQDGEDLWFSSPIGLRGISFSPQPWADGEPEYSKAGIKKMQTPPATPRSTRISIKSPSSDTRPRRARLVRRASPVKAWTTPTPTPSRCRNLVRRVAKNIEMHRKRQRARTAAHRILVKMRRLAAATLRLQREYRKLTRFAPRTRSPASVGSEDVFWLK